jgi:hypothetical protein
MIQRPSSSFHAALVTSVPKRDRAAMSWRAATSLMYAWISGWCD